MKPIKIGLTASLTLSAALLLTGVAVGQPDRGSDNRPATRPSPAAREQARGFKVLFDGTPESLQAHWRKFKGQDVPEGWRIDEDGTLLMSQGGSGDLITKEKYGNFDLRLEWKAAEGANSGIIYGISETGENTGATYETGLEMQILDDERHPDAQNGRDRLAGSLYDLVDVAEPSPVKPAGEWNRARIVVRDGRIRHFLNGEKVADVQLGSEEWKERLAASKFADWPRFAKETEGHIGLQDHGDKVWFRNIRIRPID